MDSSYPQMCNVEPRAIAYDIEPYGCVVCPAYGEKEHTISVTLEKEMNQRRLTWHRRAGEEAALKHHIFVNPCGRGARERSANRDEVHAFLTKRL